MADLIPLSRFVSVIVPGSSKSTISIKKFVESKKIHFKVGNGFYQLSKPETIQFNKTILVQRMSTPDNLVTGSNSIRKILEVDESKGKGGKYMVNENILKEFKIFVQSTSYNRNLVGGTTFLYRKDDLDVIPPAVTSTTPAVVAATTPAPATSTSSAAVASTTSAPISSTTTRTRRGAAAVAAGADDEGPAAPKRTRATRSRMAATTAEPDPVALPTLETPTPEASTRAAPTPVVTTPAPSTGAGKRGTSDKVEIVISFDTTGSMYPCLSTVRSVIRETLKKLTAAIPSIRIGILAHGDYCDEATNYITKASNNYKLCGSNETSKLIDFVTKVKPTFGGDFPECYELVLQEVRTKFDWSPDANKSLILIGDAPPHDVHQNPGRIDWRVEAAGLKDKGITVYAVQALDYQEANYFYREVAQITLGFHLRLYQFSSITGFLMAVCYREGDNSNNSNNLTTFEEELSASGQMVVNLRNLFDQLQGKTPSCPVSTGPVIRTAGGLVPVSPSRFQVLEVNQSQPIKKFAEARGLIFKAGRGFYEFTKPEIISDKKEIVLMDKTTEDFFTGWTAARELSGIDPGKATRQTPQGSDKYIVFIQSSSYNRKLIEGQRFLYEVNTDL